MLNALGKLTPFLKLTVFAVYENLQQANAAKPRDVVTIAITKASLLMWLTSTVHSHSLLRVAAHMYIYHALLCAILLLLAIFFSDVVKLTAQFVARNGSQFLTTLMNKEQRNYQFDFLRPQHSLFNYFTKLVEQYTKVCKSKQMSVFYIYCVLYFTPLYG